MKKASFNKEIMKWADRIGHGEAHSRLAKRDVSASLIEKILSRRYPSELGKVYRSIFMEEMARDGFTVAGDAAS